MFNYNKIMDIYIVKKSNYYYYCARLNHLSPQDAKTWADVKGSS